jgi:carbamoylphosphate synthase small subunit
MLEPQILKMVTQVTTGVDNAQKELSAAYIKAAQAAVENDKAYRILTQQTMDATQKAFNAHVQKMTEDTQKNIVLLDAALEKELTKSLTTLGRQLTALSQQFVADYTPLTERLRQLLADLGRR